jgi:phage repressor protein C with HTH and peptisase S24 domain
MCYFQFVKADATKFWERVSNLLTGDLNQQWLSMEAGINQSTLSSWKIKNRLPHAHEAVAIANALGVSVEFLVTGEDRSKEEDEDDIDHKCQKILGSYHIQGAVQKVTMPNNNDKIIYLPILSQKVSAGYGTDLIDDYETGEFIPVMKRLVSMYDIRSLRAVEVTGDSMTGISLMHGDIVVFAQGHIAGEGIYVITIDGEAMVKRIVIDRIKKEIRIHSENPRYPEPNVVPIGSDVISVEGKVVAWFHCHPY